MNAQERRELALRIETARIDMVNILANNGIHYGLFESQLQSLMAVERALFGTECDWSDFKEEV